MDEGILPEGLPPALRVGILRCFSCGSTVECRPPDLLRFTQVGWRRCCGEVMTLFTPSGVQASPSPPAEPR